MEERKVGQSADLNEEKEERSSDSSEESSDEYRDSEVKKSPVSKHHCQKQDLPLLIQVPTTLVLR